MLIKNKANVFAICAFIMFIIISMLLLIMEDNQRLSNLSTIKELAFDNEDKLSNDNLIYIKENGVYVPFIVVSNKFYENKSYLIRKDLLPTPAVFSEIEDFENYFASTIDTYLEKTYINNLEAKTSITDIPLNSDFGFSEKRHVFIPSMYELRSIEYFYTNSKIGYINSVPHRYWTRSSYDSYTANDIYTISVTGDESNTDKKSSEYIRPAFCINNNTPIEYSSSAIPGKRVFILKNK